jgi:hypothetical protein
MMPVWRYLPHPGVFVAAFTRGEAVKIIVCDPEDLTRVKGVYATGNPREIK